MKNIKEIDNQYIANTYARFDLCIESGKGSTYTDQNGKSYIDFGSGIAVNTFGANDKLWKDAVISQLDKIQHTSNLYYTSPQAELAKELCQRTGMKKVFFSNSGAEANECAIKTARKYSSDKYSDERNVIITLDNSFHGRTITTLSATAQESLHKSFGPFTQGFKYVQKNNIDSLKEAIDKNVCAIMFELIQGEGGVCPLDQSFVDCIFEIAQKEDILTIIDEVQTGNGRTGALYCCENYNVMPDIMSTAKGLAGGLPFGATLLGDKVKTVLNSGSHGSTFGGNPVCASGALSVLNRLDDKLFEEVMEKSKYIIDTLTTAKNVEDITGFGFMLGIKTNKDAREVAQQCLDNGLIVLTAKDKIRLLPALNITDKELHDGIKILKEVIEK